MRHIASILRQAAGRDNMVLGRVGGEEFALLLTNSPHAEALAFAEILRMRIAERPIEWRGMKTTITMSVGFATTPFCQGEVSPLLSRADGALYGAKAGGRNRLVEAQDFVVVAA